MNRLSSFLQDADPLRHDPPRRDADRERVRQMILRVSAIERITTPARTRLRLLTASAAIAIVAAVALGYQLWTDGSARLLAAVRFEVRLAEDTPTPGLVVSQVGNSARLVYLHPEIVVSNDDIAQSWVYQDDAGGFGVAMKFLPSGAERMQQATKAHVGRPLAVLIDGKVVSVPILRAPISDSATINGRFTQAEATRIADGIDRP
jgi:preprotein translocase subunit SecD